MALKDDDEAIALEENGATLGLVIEWLNEYQDKVPRNISRPIESSKFECYVDGWVFACAIRYLPRTLT